MPTNAINDTGVKYLYDKLHGEIEPVAEAVSTDETTIEGNPINFSTKSAQNAQSTIIDLEPIQDLHGYDKVWVGGAGKNKLPLVLADIKSANTDGSWSNNTYTLNSCNFTVNTDSNDNVIGIEVSGTPSATSIFTLYNKTSPFPFSSTNYIANGCPSGGSVTSNYNFNMICTISGTPIALFTDKGNGANVDFSDLESATEVEARIVVHSEASLPKTFYPMIRLATESDATFQPYTNECGISGRSEIGILGTNGKESTDPDYEVSNDLTISIGQTVYGAKLDVGRGLLVVDRVGIDLGTLSWTKQTTTHSYRFVSPSGSIQSKAYEASEKPNAISECYEALTVNNTWDGQIGLSIGGVLGSTYFAICDTNYADATDFTNGMNGVYAVYELATPITIEVTSHQIALLEGVNNISTDGDKITLTYRDGKVATLGDLKELMDKLESLDANNTEY